MLRLDTDLTTLHQSTQGARTTTLDARETLGMPLRRPQEYREDSREILHWLSRRWLYNIPHSAQTEGLRPLGRLALVDNASELFERLGEAVANVTDPESLHRTAETTGLQFREQVPRIFVLASISGGTVSGMVLDVVYGLRNIAASPTRAFAAS